MTKKYKPVRLPREAFDNWQRKIKEIEQTLNSEGKKVKIHFTDGLRFFSQRPVYIYNDEVIDYFIKKRNRRLI